MFSSHLHPKPIQIAFVRSLTVVLDNDQQYYPFTGFIHSMYLLFISLIIAALSNILIVIFHEWQCQYQRCTNFDEDTNIGTQKMFLS